MKKFIEIPSEVMECLAEGKCVKGSLRLDEWTGKMTFRAYRRQPRRPERVVCQLEHGWLKESPLRYKFYSSVKKSLEQRAVSVAMRRDLDAAMQMLEIEQILNEV